ncbi:Uncharacterized protein PBTT_06093 [Plasmodiophora brassicae]
MPPKAYARNKQKGARRRRQTGGQPSSATGTPQHDGQESPDAEGRLGKFEVGAGYPDARWLWTVLSREEKRDILDIYPEEVVACCLTPGLADSAPEELYRSLDAMIDDPTFMTSIRCMFVSGIDGPNPDPVLDLPEEFPPIALAMLRVFNRHLLTTHSRHSASARLMIFTVLAVIATRSFGFIVKSCILFGASAAYVWRGHIDVPALTPGMFRDAFNDSEDRASIWVSNVMLYSLCYWSPDSTLLKIIAFVPYGLHIIKDRVASEDTRLLQFVCQVTAFGVNLIVMYFAWFSYTYTIVSAMLILPGLTTLIFWGLVLALNVALGLIDLAISYIPPINHFTGRNPLAYVVSSLATIYSMYYSSLWAALTAIICMPQVVRNVILAVLSTFVPRVVEAANTIMIVRGVPLLITIIVVVGSSLLHRAYDIARSRLRTKA